MIIPDSWLAEWLPRKVPANTLVRGLTCAGIEASLLPPENNLCDPGVGTSIGVELTSNRGDCLSIRGLSREVAVITHQKHKEPKIDPVIANHRDFIPIEVLAPQDCPRYLGRVIRGLDPSVNTPDFVRKRLSACGLTPVLGVVDVLNYVMLELGQPMHAFEFRAISGGIQVRKAGFEEKLRLLNEKTVELNPDTLVIADAEKPLALGGVMGGYDSGVSENTTDIFIESAFFQPKVIFGRAQSYGLTTDASYRFERGVDPELPRTALERATALLVSFAGGKVGPVMEVSDPRYLPTQAEIKLSRDKICKLIGLDVPFDDTFVVETLTGLGFGIQTEREGWRVKVPSFRFDVACEEDLIEELARIYGLDRIPTKPMVHFARQQTQERKNNLTRIRERLVSRGYQEVITYGFIKPALSSLIYPHLEAIALQNPISTDMAVMRPGLWPGLIEVAKYNQHRQSERARLFEIGMRFYLDSDKKKVVQESVIAGLLWGALFPEQWGVRETSADFFDLKNDLCALLSLTQMAEAFQFLKQSSHRALHPEQSSALFFRGQQVGDLGLLHPKLIEKLDFAGSLLLFELKLGVLLQSECFKILPPPKFPFIRRDLALILDKQQKAEEVVLFCKKEAGFLLREIIVFDLYEGENLPFGKKSLGLGFVWQDRDRTLFDKEVDDVMDHIVVKLTERFGASLRSS